MGTRGRVAPVAVGTLGQVVLAAGGTFQAVPGRGQRAGGRELQGRVQAGDDLHTQSNRRPEGVRKGSHLHLGDLKAGETRRSLGGSQIWTWRLRDTCMRSRERNPSKI